jgi:autotransporter-associated beta strand protein
MSGLLFDVGTDDTLTLSGNMTTGAGTGGLEKTGAGTLILTRANTYTGGTTVNAGTLQIGDGSNTTAAVAGTTTLSGGNLSYNYNAAKFDVNGAITLTAEATITKLNSSFQMNFGSGTLNGGGQTLNISSAGNLPIYFNQTYGTALGHINILSGIAAQADTALPLRNATMNISNGAQFRTWNVGTINNNITLNGGAGPNGTGALYNEHTTSPTYSGTITLADATNSTIGSASTGGITISGQVTGGGSLTKNNTFTLTLSGNNTYTGTTTINAGTLTLSGGRAIADTGAVSVSSGAVLNLSASETVGSITGVGNITLGANTLTSGGDNSSTTLTGVISGVGGGLTKNGTGTLTLTSASSNYTGGTTLNTGTLVIGNAAAAGNGTITQTDATSLLKFDTTGTIGNAMSIYNVSANKTVTLSGGITVNNAVFDVASGETLTISNTINGTGGVTKNGTGTLVLSGSNSYSAPTTINAGTLEAANANALGSNNTVTVNDGTLLVSTDDAINGRQITLNGTSTTVATLAFSSNYTGSIGKLTLSANSIIDLGQYNIGLQFADMAMGFYNLSIYNWSGTNYWGTTYGTGTDQLYFNGNYTASNVKFYSGAVGSDSFVGSGFDLGLQQTSWDSGLSGHYILPVPEPETYATGLLLVLGSGVWLWRKRKKFTTQSNLEGAAPSAPIEKW